MSTSRDSCCLPSVKRQKHDWAVIPDQGTVIPNPEHVIPDHWAVIPDQRTVIPDPGAVIPNPEHGLWSLILALYRPLIPDPLYPVTTLLCRYPFFPSNTLLKRWMHYTIFYVLHGQQAFWTKKSYITAFRSNLVTRFWNDENDTFLSVPLGKHALERGRYIWLSVPRAKRFRTMYFVCSTQESIHYFSSTWVTW